MILQLTKDMRIETTAVSTPEFVLKRRHVIADTAVGGKASKRAGEVDWRPLGYFGSVESAASRAVDYHLAALDGELTLADVAREVRELKASLKEALG